MKMTKYHTFYTLDYIAEKGLRIKPKDEEEAKQVIAYLYAMGYQWLSYTMQDTFYSYYGDKTSYCIYPDKEIAFSGEMNKWIAPQQIVGKEETDNIGSNCSFDKFIKEQVKTNTIKEENEMLELVKLYKDRKMDKLFKDADAAQSVAWEKDTTYKALKDLAEKTKTKDGYLFTFNFEVMPDSVRKEIDKIQKDREEKEIQLNKFIDEVNAQLDLCETYGQKIVVLTGYEILDESGRLTV